MPAKLCHNLPQFCGSNNISSLVVSLTDIFMTSGSTKLHTELEELVAKFVGKPAAILFGMAYVTNSAIIPAAIGKVCCHTLFFRFFS
jgi:serine palmitoyltransferase